ncbi:precorrin-4 C(11)-methyltransferase [Deinococcus planocerae]|uniref:precorrin-4 C(11)-methyltransferase n=1 Tax=Deinococcus planocerae TaxID=1737569 RepID=UPI000C7EDE6D|nr:precorrin-4 C(11)-methyltransferase [Deinococcus planocerae]
MKVYFIGAGPGAPDLITLRGARLLGSCRLILYAGSLVPEAVLEHAHQGAERVNTAGLNLDEQVALYRRALEQGLDVARVHSGDPAIYGATAEQMRALRELGIEYEVVPGVSSFTACAAVLGAELTRPNVTQTVILTRASGRASPVPERENLRGLAEHGASLCVFLGGNQLPEIVADLLDTYGPDMPVALVQRASQPQERRHVSTLGRLLSEIRVSEWALTTMLIVSPALSEPEALETTSRLYDPAYAHRFRRAVKEGGEA